MTFPVDLRHNCAPSVPCTCSSHIEMFTDAPSPGSTIIVQYEPTTSGRRTCSASGASSASPATASCQPNHRDQLAPTQMMRPSDIAHAEASSPAAMQTASGARQISLRAEGARAIPAASDDVSVQGVEDTVWHYRDALE